MLITLAAIEHVTFDLKLFHFQGFNGTRMLNSKRLSHSVNKYFNISDDDTNKFQSFFAVLYT